MPCSAQAAYLPPSFTYPTRASAKGAVTGRTVALGYVKHGPDALPLATPGEPNLVVECYGHTWPVTLLEQPPVAVGGRPAEAPPAKVAVGA